MRTTITLDPDTADLLRNYMESRKLTFKQAVNQIIRSGLTPPGPKKRFEIKTASLGLPAVDLTKALSLAAQLEDEEIIRKMRLGK